MSRQRIASLFFAVAIAVGAAVPARAGAGAVYSPVGYQLTFLSWPADPASADYALFVNGRRVSAEISTPHSFIEGGRVEAAVSALLGPADVVEVAGFDASGDTGVRTRVTYVAYEYVFIPELNLRFAEDRTMLDASSLTKLRSFAQLIERHGFTRTIAVGHDAGEVGAPNAYRLGQLRAKAAATALGRLVEVPTVTSSWGNGAPIASNATALGRAVNRRVELGLR